MKGILIIQICSRCLLRRIYLRLKNFVLDVKVNDMMSEEEKEMIISVCDKQINKQN